VGVHRFRARRVVRDTPATAGTTIWEERAFGYHPLRASLAVPSPVWEAIVAWNPR